MYLPALPRALAGSPALRVALLAGVVLLLAQTHVLAQRAGASPAATMTTVKAFAVVFLRGLMAIGLIIALLKVAKNFLSGSPESVTSFLWLVGGLVIFFGWGFFFRDTLGTWSAPSATLGNIGNSNLNQAVSSGAYQMAQRVLDTMLTTVAPLLLFTTVALTVVRGFISSGTVQFELGPIFRVMFLYIALLSYNVLVPQVGNLIGGVAQLINDSSQNTSAYTVLKQMRDAAAEQASPTGTVGPNPGQTGGGTQDGASLMGGLATSISTAFADMQAAFSPQKILLGLATDFMTGMIQAIMEFIQSFLLAFLYVSGPIAIAFSFIPGFGGVAKSWLQSLIGIHMWSIAFQVIAGLFVFYQAHEAAQSTSSGANMLMNMTGIAQTKFAVACIVFIIMYIMVPYMSSLIVGSSAADSFVSSALRIGAAVASGGAAAGGAALGVAGAGAQGANAAGAAGAGVAGKAAAFGRAATSSVQNSMGMGAGGNLGNIGQMLAGGPPSMAGAATQNATGSAVRSAAPQGPTPQRFTGATMGSASSSAGAGSAQTVDAQSVASSAGPNGGSVTGTTAPVMSTAAAAPAGATIQQAVANSGPGSTGGSAGGFGGFASSLVRPAVPPIAINPNEKPPTLPGAQS